MIRNGQALKNRLVRAGPRGLGRRARGRGGGGEGSAPQHCLVRERHRHLGWTQEVHGARAQPDVGEARVRQRRHGDDLQRRRR